MKTVARILTEIVVVLGIVIIAAVCALYGIDKMISDSIKNCSGFGHAYMIGFCAISTGLAVLVCEAIVFYRVRRTNRAFGSAIVMYLCFAAITTMVSVACLTLLYWSLHRVGGHTCQAWSP